MSVVEMKTSEWLKIAAVIRERWPHSPLPLESVARFGEDLADLPTEHVVAAVEAIYREGREFAPNGGIIRRKVAELSLGAPDWGTVLRELARIGGKSTNTYRGRDDAEGNPIFEDDRTAALEAADPLIREFVMSIGWAQIRAVESGSDEARLRDKWRAFCDRVQREVILTGIPAGDLRELRRIEGAPRRLGDSVNHLARQIGPGAKAA